MTATVTYAVTMPELRGDPAPSSLWSNYGAPVHMSPRMGSVLESGIVNPSPVSSHASRPRSEQTNMDHQTYSYGRYPQEETDSYSNHAHTGGLGSHGYQNSLKRSYSQTEQPPSQELVQDIRDDGSRVTVNHDHKLLAFRRAQDKHAITDQHGRLQQLELSAQLHGMFFLSEMPSNATDGTNLQPELTCYRRNLFQISGSLITPRGQLSVMTESGENVPISSMEVTISAIESVDGNPVRLIVIPWKTPPPNSPEVNQNPDQEPPALPLIPFQEDGTESDGDYAVYPIGWRRLQFRIATANNGRRKELQQHFVLHLKVFATLTNNSKVVLTESTTAPIVVRGRSPRNFQARKEIPLLGSSAGSRGQALVETGLGVVAGTLNMKAQAPKARSSMENMQVPRSAGFTFNAPKPTANAMNPVRSNSNYPAWSSATSGPLPQVPSSTPGSYPPSTMAPDMYQKVPLAGGSNFSAEGAEIPLQTTMPQPVQMGLISEDQQQPMRSQYTYVQSGSAPRHMPLGSSAQPSSDHAANVPRYVDDARPAKVSRTTGHQSVHGSGNLAANDAPAEYRYGSYAPAANGGGEVGQPNYVAEPAVTNPAPSRELYQSPQTWTTTAAEASPTVAYAGHDGRPYAYDHYKSRPGSSQQIKAGGHASQPEPYGGGHRGSFDGMNNYSWGSG